MTPVSIRTVINAVEAYCDLVPGALQLATRPRHLSDARHLTQYLCRRLTTATDPQIGRALGGLDQTTVSYGADRIERLLPGEPGLREAVTIVTATIEAVIAQGALAPSLGADRDVLDTARAIGAGRIRPTDVASDDVVAMARCLVGYAHALEADDEAAGREGGGVLIEAVGALLQARAAVDRALTPETRRTTREAYEATWDRLARLHDSLKDA